MKNTPALLIASILALALAPATRAADVFWQAGSAGSWDNTGNWIGGILPAADDNVLVDSGTITIANGITAGVSGTLATAGTTAIGLTAGLSSSLIIENGGQLVTSNTVFAIGDSGDGYMEIRTGGKLQTGGYIYANQIGGQLGSSGTVIIKNGGSWESYGGIYTGNHGTGRLHVETGGTLTIAAGASLYLGERIAGSGTAIIDGYFRSGNNGTTYQPVGKNGTANSSFILGATGTAVTGYLSIGMSAGSIGTAIIKGDWSSASASYTRVGSAGKGTLIIEDGGHLSLGGGMTVGTSGTSTGYLEVQQGGTLYFNNKNLYLGDANSASGTAVISGSVLNVNTFYVGNNSTNDNTLIINDGGYLETTANTWFARNYSKSTSLVSGTNKAYVAGVWDTGGYFVLGNNTGHSILDIATTGTVIARATGIRITYTHPDSTAYVNVDGYMEAAGTAYIIVAHYGDSYMRVGATGRVKAGGYISIGQGDTADGGVTNPLTASGTVDVFGYMEAGTYLRVANRLTGVLNLAASGTIKTDTYFAVSENASIASSGTANIDGRLDVGTDITLGVYSMNIGYLNLANTSNVTGGGNYSQNANSTLAVTVGATRVSPFIDVAGGATLSGTLQVTDLESMPGFVTADTIVKSGDLPAATVIRAAGGFAGDFTNITAPTPILSGTVLPDYISLGKNIVDATDYRVGLILTWHAAAEGTHGTFTIDAGKSFTIDTPLADRTGVARFTSGWDGKSLVKRGAGTLVLAAADTRTGDTTIESGTLRVATPAVSLGNLINTAVLDLGGSTVGGYHTAEALTLVGSGTIILALESAAPGAAGDKLIINGDASGTHATYVSINGAAPVAATPAQIAARITVAGSNTATFDGTGVPAGLAVTFNPQGGTVSPASKAIQRNTAYGALPTPVRGSTVFDGWWTAPTGGTQVTSATMVASDATSHILHARWKTGHQDIIPEVGNDLYGSIMDETGAPVAGVVVSDGFQCVLTDANGVYQMKRNAKARMVYYSTPENFAINTMDAFGKPGMAMFHAKLTSQQRYDFDLVRLPAPEKDFILLAVGDPQVKNTGNLARYKNETVADMAQFAKTATLPAYAILLGDICYDSLPLLGSIRDATNLAGIPHFGVIGNHDHDQTISNDHNASAQYEETYGPANYSFNRGDVHIIGLDDILYNGNQKYVAGLTNEILEWVRQDLSFVPKTKTIIVAFHIPLRGYNYNYQNAHNLYNLLKDYADVHFFSGHTHYQENITFTISGSTKNITAYEHIHGGACGAWWNSLVNTDGAPNGYGVFTVSGTKLADWYYKPTGYSDTYQMRMYRGNVVFSGSFSYNKTANDIVVDAWNSDSNWEIIAYENGVAAGAVSKIPAMPDAYANGYHKGVRGGTSSSYSSNNNKHLYIHTLKKSDAQVEIRATDRFGKTYTLSDFTTDLDEFPANFASPEITVQPANANANVGQSVTFTAAAGGAPAPWFKWQSSGDGATWTDVPAASAAALTLTAAVPMDGVQYRFVATNARGNATSAAVTLTVNQAPTITTHPSNQSVIEGQNATFTVTATGNPVPQYQWQSAPAGSTTWGDISGATSAAYTVPATTAQNGMQYRCVASNGINPNATSAAATLTVTSQAVADAQALKTQIETPDIGTITVSGTVDLSLVGGATLAPGNTIVGAGATSTITGNLTIPESASGTVITGVNFTEGTLTINGASDVDVSHCTFADAPVSITGNADNIAFSWNKFTATSGGSGSAMTISNAGKDTGVLLHNNLWGDGLKSDMPSVTNAQVYMYNNYFTATGNTTATVAGEGAQILSVNNLYEGTNNPLTTQSTGKLHASGNDTSTTTGTTATGDDEVFVPSYSRVITSADTLALLITANAGNTDGKNSVPPAQTNGTASISATVTGAGSGTTASSAHVPALGGFTLTANATGFTPESRQWYLDNFAIAGATAETYVVTNADKETHAGTYAVALTATTGEIVTSGAFTVTVGELAAPVITKHPSAQTITVGGSATFTVTATGAGLTYQWKKNGTDIPGATNANLVVTNAQKSDAGNYTVVVTNPAGSKTSNPATLTVNDASSGGGGGGGGAPSLFLLSSLLILLAGRGLRQRRKQ
ncbi:autotransporter-associated beta strand protein/T5SS/PEP-CTERM-associated repeat protein [Ereboglobus sp. PH5-5]|uniref:calcineurin-like phosphoesterase C-terminal domain-containing protein n=1 Tax=Ereboglobus sp. PH5-5 TaxID=2940529 RepID=UPI00240614C2|nr:calcineurin-like phosphoesterase C-terminal domain-containing protein [Ereboglobus sp. PH5-5]MDF9832450.1 autotransporter-associated beta strand protein/T5SS/PEP-CTERM-associated repeat protein [Ereboglobus sp. PH5-5]